MRLKLCAVGVHLHCVEGVGGMGDGILCLDCGYEKYPEVFLWPPRVIVDLDDIEQEEVERVWWPRIEAARALRRRVPVASGSASPPTQPRPCPLQRPRAHLGLTAHELAAQLLAGPDVDVLMEDLSSAASTFEMIPEIDPSLLPLQRVAGLRVAHIRADCNDINLDIDYQTAPFQGSRAAVLVAGVNSPDRES